MTFRRNHRSKLPNIRVLPDSASKPLPWWRSKIVVAFLILASTALMTPWIQSYFISSLIHYAADDNSDSAINDLDLRKPHCQSSNSQYKEGDIKRQISYAHKPEVVRQEEITNTFNLGKCDKFPKHSKEITRYSGTSLIILLEYLNTLIKADRVRGKKNPVVVTITLQEAESGPNLPKMDEFGFQRIQKLVEEIQKQHGVVVIIGPTGNLQQNLNNYLSTYGNSSICNAVDIDKCIVDAFSKARTLKPVQ